MHIYNNIYNKEKIVQHRTIKLCGGTPLFYTFQAFHHIYRLDFKAHYSVYEK